MVITFLPYADKENPTQGFYKSAECLDNQRLIKQVLEAKQILDALEKAKCTSDKVAWANHSAAKMWEGYENALRHYHNVVLEVRKKRFNSKEGKQIKLCIDGEIVMPPWYGNPIVHYTHQAALIRKAPACYTTNPEDKGHPWLVEEGIVKTVFDNLPDAYLDKGYVWPTNIETSYNIKEVVKVYWKDLEKYDPINPPDEIFAKLNPDTYRNADISEFDRFKLEILRKNAPASMKKYGKEKLYCLLVKGLKEEEYELLN
jgi:hypothetical protein